MIVGAIWSEYVPCRKPGMRDALRICERAEQLSSIKHREKHDQKKRTLHYGRLG